ncbi:MAG: RDD family protein [Verrucomicrobiales bacterium]|nr:RDD family protein [Verrucomicrobiales bacterium]
MLGKTTSLHLRTPEGVAFELPLASPVSRCLALVLDVLVVTVIVQIVRFVLAALANMGMVLPFIGDSVQDFSMAAMILIDFVVWIFYGIVMEWVWRGRTVGKMVMKLQVVDERGLDLGLKQIIMRNLFRVVDGLPKFYLVGGLCCLLNRRCQRLGDIAAGTVVIRRVQVNEPELEQVLDGKENSFRAFPHLEARLRQKITPDEARIALDAVMRRNELEPKHRLNVFSEMADFFRGLSEFPEETVIGLSDEQYVRNVVDTLYRKTVL